VPGSDADIFVSYKAEDRARLAPLVKSLESEGLSVWWDADIGGGSSWRQEIQEQLEAAKCVIVAWSRRSVGPEGEFVRDEAERARRRGTYLPVCIDDVAPPLGFGEVQAIKIKGWKGDPADRRYQAVLAATRGIIAGERPRGPASTHRPVVGRRAVVVGGAAATLALASGTWFVFGRRSAGESNSIAVLPFANLSGDPDQAYFSDGIAEELRSALSRIPGLKVIARTSSELVRDVDARAAASTLGVGDIVTGSVRRSSEMIRITAQLVDGGDGSERWSQVYDRPIGDTLRIQTENANQVAQALSLTLAEDGVGELSVGGSANQKAHDLFLQAEAVLQSSPNVGTFRRAITLYDAAIQNDPNYAKAYARKAVVLTELTGSESNFADWDKEFADAEAFARRAIQLAPNLTNGHSALAFVRWYRLDFRGALAEFRRANSLPGADGESLANYVFFLGALGFSAEARDLADRFIALDPLNPRAHGTKARMLFYAHRYNDALKAAQIALKLVPDREPTISVMGDSLLLLGRLDEAEAAYSRLPPDDLYGLASRAIAAERSGDHAASTMLLEKARRLYGLSAIYQIAEVHAQRGEMSEAFAALDEALRVRDPGLTGLRKDPFMDPIRNDPRYASLIAKLNFP
jgi:serine/threonine-protein kinase